MRGPPSSGARPARSNSLREFSIAPALGCETVPLDIDHGPSGRTKRTTFLTRWWGVRNSPLPGAREGWVRAPDLPPAGEVCDDPVTSCSSHRVRRWNTAASETTDSVFNTGFATTIRRGAGL